MNLNLQNKAAQWAVFFLLSLTWGSSFILMKKGMYAFSDTQVAALRIFSAFVFMLPIGIRYLKHLQKKDIVALIVVGLCGNGIPAFLFTKAETVLDSSIVGILNALVPLFTLITGVIWFGLIVKWRSILGILVGLGGAVVLILPELQLPGMGNAVYALLPVLATLCYAISLNTIKAKLAHMKSLAITVIAFCFVGPFAGVYLFSTDFVPVLMNHPEAISSLVYTLILGVVGTALAVLIFNELIKETTPVFASSVTYVIPVVALLWGALDGELIRPYHLLGVGLILFGVYLVNLRNRRERKAGK